MPDFPNKAPVKIEDLLQLKRAERPSAEFWTKFEHELRQKQLTALVHKRRWWHGLPVLLSRRLLVPAGTAAIVTFTFVSVRLANTSVVSQVEMADHRREIAAVPVENLPVTEVAVAANSDAAVRSDLGALPEQSSRPRDVAPTRDLTESVALQPLPAAVSDGERPSAKSIAATLARLEQAEPELVNSVMSGRLSSPARAQSAVMDSSAEPVPASRYRLIARYAEHSLNPEPAAPAPVRERLARRLGDDITERISRIGVEGSRVSLKF